MKLLFFFINFILFLSSCQEIQKSEKEFSYINQREAEGVNLHDTLIINGYNYYSDYLLSYPFLLKKGVSKEKFMELFEKLNDFYNSPISFSNNNQANFPNPSLTIGEHIAQASEPKLTISISYRAFKNLQYIIGEIQKNIILIPDFSKILLLQNRGKYFEKLLENYLEKNPKSKSSFSEKLGKLKIHLESLACNLRNCFLIKEEKIKDIKSNTQEALRLIQSIKQLAEKNCSQILFGSDLKEIIGFLDYAINELTKLNYYIAQGKSI